MRKEASEARSPPFFFETDKIPMNGACGVSVWRLFCDCFGAITMSMRSIDGLNR